MPLSNSLKFSIRTLFVKLPSESFEKINGSIRNLLSDSGLMLVLVDKFIQSMLSTISSSFSDIFLFFLSQNLEESPKIKSLSSNKLFGFKLEYSPSKILGIPLIISPNDVKSGLSITVGGSLIF